MLTERERLFMDIWLSNYNITYKKQQLANTLNMQNMNVQMVRNWIHDQYVQEELMNKFGEYCWIKKRTLKRGFVITKLLIQQVQKEFSMITEKMILMAYRKVCNNKNQEEPHQNDKDNNNRNHQVEDANRIDDSVVSINEDQKQIDSDKKENKRENLMSHNKKNIRKKRKKHFLKCYHCEY